MLPPPTIVSELMLRFNEPLMVKLLAAGDGPGLRGAHRQGRVDRRRFVRDNAAAGHDQRAAGEVVAGGAGVDRQAMGAGIAAHGDRAAGGAEDGLVLAVAPGSPLVFQPPLPPDHVPLPPFQVPLPRAPVKYAGPLQGIYDGAVFVPVSGVGHRVVAARIGIPVCSARCPN